MPLGHGRFLSIFQLRRTYETAQDADVLVVVTEWNEFRGLDLDRIGAAMNTKRIVDLRNVYKTGDMRRKGFEYVSVGRPAFSPEKTTELKSVADA